MTHTRAWHIAREMHRIGRHSYQNLRDVLALTKCANRRLKRQMSQRIVWEPPRVSQTDLDAQWDALQRHAATATARETAMRLARFAEAKVRAQIIADGPLRVKS